MLFFSPVGFLLLTLALLMSGCQAYAPRALPETVQWSDELAVSERPLTLDEVVRLALANSPDVLRGKQDLAIASAKAYADGLRVACSVQTCCLLSMCTGARSSARRYREIIVQRGASPNGIGRVSYWLYINV